MTSPEDAASIADVVSDASGEKLAAARPPVSYTHLRAHET